MFRVEWEPLARSELFRVWASAPDPAAVLRATDNVDGRLAADPFGTARYLSEDLWQVTVPPLVVTFEVDAPTRTVIVTTVGTAAP